MKKKNKFLSICIASLKCVEPLHNQFVTKVEINSAKLGRKHVQGLPNLEAKCQSQHGKFRQKIHNFWKMCTPNLETRLSTDAEDSQECLQYWIYCPPWIFKLIFSCKLWP